MTDSEEDDSRSRRRIALLLLVAVVVLLGAGVGTITIFGPDDGGESPTDQPSVTPTATLTDTSTVTITGTATTTVEGGTQGPTETPSGTTPTTQGETSTPTDTTPRTTTPTRTPSVTPTPTRTQTGNTGGGQGGDGDTSDEQATVSLDAPDDATLLQTNGVVPGQSGSETLTLTNGGEQAGTIRLADVTVIDHENGIVDPEAPVDDSPNEGELSDAVEIKLTFAYPDGEHVYVAGSSSSYVSLSSLTGSASPDKTVQPGQRVTVELDWRIDRSAANEIQSDGTTFDAVFELRAPES